MELYDNPAVRRKLAKDWKRLTEEEQLVLRAKRAKVGVKCIVCGTIGYFTENCVNNCVLPNDNDDSSEEENDRKKTAKKKNHNIHDEQDIVTSNLGEIISNVRSEGSLGILWKRTESISTSNESLTTVPSKTGSRSPKRKIGLRNNMKVDMNTVRPQSLQEMERLKDEDNKIGTFAFFSTASEGYHRNYPELTLHQVMRRLMRLLSREINKTVESLEASFDTTLLHPPSDKDQATFYPKSFEDIKEFQDYFISKDKNKGKKMMYQNRASLRPIDDLDPLFRGTVSNDDFLYRLHDNPGSSIHSKNTWKSILSHSDELASSDPMLAQKQKALDKLFTDQSRWIKMQKKSMTFKNDRFEHLVNILKTEMIHEHQREAELLLTDKHGQKTKDMEIWLSRLQSVDRIMTCLEAYRFTSGLDEADFLVFCLEKWKNEIKRKVSTKDWKPFGKMTGKGGGTIVDGDDKKRGKSFDDVSTYGDHSIGSFITSAPKDFLGDGSTTVHELKLDGKARAVRHPSKQNLLNYQSDGHPPDVPPSSSSIPKKSMKKKPSVHSVPSSEDSSATPSSSSSILDNKMISADGSPYNSSVSFVKSLESLKIKKRKALLKQRQTAQRSSAPQLERNNVVIPSYITHPLSSTSSVSSQLTNHTPMGTTHPPLTSSTSHSRHPFAVIVSQSDSISHLNTDINSRSLSVSTNTSALNSPSSVHSFETHHHFDSQHHMEVNLSEEDDLERLVLKTKALSEKVYHDEDTQQKKKEMMIIKKKTELKVEKHRHPREVDRLAMQEAKDQFRAASLVRNIRRGVDTDLAYLAPALVPVPGAFHTDHGPKSESTPLVSYAAEKALYEFRKSITNTDLGYTPQKLLPLYVRNTLLEKNGTSAGGDQCEEVMAKDRRYSHYIGRPLNRFEPELREKKMESPQKSMEVLPNIENGRSRRLEKKMLEDEKTKMKDSLLSNSFVRLLFRKSITELSDLSDLKYVDEM